MKFQKYSDNSVISHIENDDNGDYYLCDDIDPVLEAIEAIRWSNEVDDFYNGFYRKSQPAPFELYETWISARDDCLKASVVLGISEVKVAKSSRKS